MGELTSIALITAAQLLLLTIMQAWISSRKERRDYARQDEVANRVAGAATKAADAAALLVKAQAETIARTDEVAKLAAESDKRIGEQLTKIHILVNSDMTAARLAELNALKLLALSLKRLNQGQADEEETIRVESRIDELEHILADRYAAAKAVEAEAQRAAEASVIA